MLGAGINYFGHTSRPLLVPVGSLPTLAQASCQHQAVGWSPKAPCTASFLSHSSRPSPSFSTPPSAVPRVSVRQGGTKQPVCWRCSCFLDRAAGAGAGPPSMSRKAGSSQSLKTVVRVMQNSHAVLHTGFVLKLEMLYYGPDLLLSGKWSVYMWEEAAYKVQFLGWVL